MNQIGIYSITCTKNGRRYIGQSRVLNKRKWQHFNELDHNKHHNKYLQNTYNKYKKENFKFEVIENCEIEKLNEREAYWISYYNSNDIKLGYNQKEISHLLTCSEEHRENCKKTTIKRNVDRYGLYTLFNLQTGEVTQVGSKKEYTRDKEYNYKKHFLCLRDWTLEDFKKHYERYNYYHFCQNGIDSSNNFTEPRKIYGKNLTTGEVLEFPSISGAGRSLGIRAQGISNVINGKKLSTNGYTFSTTADFPDESKMFKQNDFPVYILDKNGVRYYESRYQASGQEFLNDNHATSYIKDFINTERTYKGCRFFSTQPTEVDVVRAKYDLSPNETLAYKIIYENKVIQPQQLPSTSKSRNHQIKKKLISYNLITQCPTTHTISLTN